MSESTTITLSSLDEFRDCTLELARKAQRQIVIFTPDLEPYIYDSTLFIEAALTLIKRSRHTRIRIIATETKQLLESGHQILKLFRHTDEQFQLKKFSTDPANTTSTYFICDDHSIIRRQDASLYRGLCYTDDRARVKDQLEEFDQLWNIASADPNLRPLTL